MQTVTERRQSRWAKEGDTLILVATEQRDGAARCDVYMRQRHQRSMNLCDQLLAPYKVEGKAATLPYVRYQHCAFTSID